MTPLELRSAPSLRPTRAPLRLLGLLMLLLATAISVLAPAPSAQAVSTVAIGAGSPFGTGTPFANGTSSPADFCTLAAVGRDKAGRLVALTAGHCARDTVSGDLLELWVGGQKVGQFASQYDNSPSPQYLPGYYDFAFAVLDESKVTLKSFGGANVSSGLLAPTAHVGTFNKICKQGMATGYTCGTYIGDGGTTPREHLSTLAAQSGDSGGPMFTPAGKLVGIASKGGSGSSYYSDVRDASSYALARGWVGGGFQPLA